MNSCTCNIIVTKLPISIANFIFTIKDNVDNDDDRLHDDDSDNDDEELAWGREARPIVINQFIQPVGPNVQVLQLFNTFFTPALILDIVLQTNLYAQQCLEYEMKYGRRQLKRLPHTWE